jgi:membrane associated rhomboid family serine protease
MDSFFSPRPLSSPNPTLFNPIFRRAFSNGYRPDPYATFHSARMAIRTIIALNTAVFGTWYYARTTRDSKLLQWLNENFTLSMTNYRAGRYWTLLTSAFSHNNFVHFLFNMVAFNAFGTILSLTPGVGAFHVAALCVGSAITGNFAFLYQRGLTSPSNTRFPNAIGGARGIEFSALGASGMVMGAGLAATCLMPTAPMALMFLPVAMPLWAIMSIYVGIDMYYLDEGTSKIGHSAHLGGALYGAAYYFGYLRKYGGVWRTVRRMFRR